MNGTSSRNRVPVPVAVPLGGPWTRRAWEPGSGTREWVTAACSRCRAVPWDESLGMIVTFASIEQAREELPRDLGWPVVTMPGGAGPVLCPRCAAGTVP